MDPSSLYSVCLGQDSFPVLFRIPVPFWPRCYYSIRRPVCISFSFLLLNSIISLMAATHKPVVISCRLTVDNGNEVLASSDKSWQAYLSPGSPLSGGRVSSSERRPSAWRWCGRYSCVRDVQQLLTAIVFQRLLPRISQQRSVVCTPSSFSLTEQRLGETTN